MSFDRSNSDWDMAGFNVPSEGGFSLASLKYLPALMQAMTGLMGAAGGERAAAGALEAAQATSAMKLYQQQQALVNKGQDIASAQRAELEADRQTRLVASRITMLAAASGGGTGGSVGTLLEKTYGRGAYAAAVAHYEGAKKAREDQMIADARGYEAEQAIRGGEQMAEAYRSQGATAGMGGLASAATSLFSKYNPSPAGGFLET